MPFLLRLEKSDDEFDYGVAGTAWGNQLSARGHDVDQLLYTIGDAADRPLRIFERYRWLVTPLQSTLIAAEREPDR